MNTTTAATVTRTTLTGGKFQYNVTLAGGRTYTELKASAKLYSAASVYLLADGETVVFLHRDLALAVKGSADARRCGWTQVGVVEIV